MWKDELLRLLLNKNINLCELAELERLNSMRIKGKSMVLVEPNDESQLLFVLRAVKDVCAPFRIVGGMTNTLVSDEIFYGVLIRTTRIDWVEFTENREVYADCGASLGSIVLGAADRGIGGFSELVGVPGTVGGALYGNAGAHGRAISDTVRDVNAYDIIDDKKIVLTADEIDYGYRDSLFKRESRYVILSARLRGFSSDRNEIKAKMHEYTSIRRQRQPLSMPSLGSIFKHPHGDFAPRLIESLGLKGLRVGGAEISKKHAGFIVNVGGASADDYICLADFASETVYKRFGIKLVREVEYY